MKTIETKEEFDALLKECKDKNQLLVVDFYADWCGPCRVIAPKLAAFADKYTNVEFCKVNVDDSEELTEQYEVSAMPTFLFFKDGKKVETVVGASEAKIEEAIKI